MKKSILLLFAFVALSTNAFAQDGGSKSFSMYVCGGTGNFVSTAEEGEKPNSFTDAWAEIGIGYSHDFDNGFGYYLGAVVVAPAWDEDANGDDDYYDGTWSSVYFPSLTAGVSYGIGGFGAYVELDSDYGVDLGASYGMDLGNAGGLSFAVDFELSPFDGYTSAKYSGGGEYDDSVDDDKAVAYGFVDLLQVQVAYSIGFAENWGFGSALKFRFSEDDDKGLAGFGESFAFRWDNTVSYDANDNLGLWAMVRYNASQLASYNGVDSKDDAVHYVELQAGINYSFDLK